MIDEHVAPNFWLSELLASDTAERLGLENTPDAQAMYNLRTMLGPGLQRVRDLLGLPVTVTSGYRGAALNRAVGGSASSQHMQGLAADFRCPAFGTPRVVAERCMQHAFSLRYDQLIWEGSWVHISFTPGRPRSQVLTAKFNGGRATYTPGLA